MLTVSYSEIKKWRFCRQSHYYRYVEGIEPRIKSKPLKMGSLVHEAIETWAKTGKYDEFLVKVTKEYDRMFDEEQELYGDIPLVLEKILSGYIARYAKERKSYSLVEKSLGPVPLTKRTDFKLKIDRLTTTQAGLTLCETKTAKKLPDEDLRMWDLQTVLYVWALRELGYPVKAILWDYIRTKTPTEPTVLKNGSLSQKSDMDTDHATYLDAVKRIGGKAKDYVDILDKLKKGPQNRFYKRILLPINDRMIESVLADARMSSLEILSFKGIPVRNISGFTCPRCFYSSLCHASLRGLDESFILKSEYKMVEKEAEHGKESEEDED